MTESVDNILLHKNWVKCELNCTANVKPKV